MLDVVISFWRKQDTLEKRFFWMVLLVICGAIVSAAIFTLCAGLSQEMTLVSAPIWMFACLSVGVFTLKTGHYSVGYFILCSLLSWVLLPFLFFACGGIRSGMPIYMLGGVCLFAFGKSGKAKIIGASIAVVVNLTALVVSLFHGELVFDVLDGSKLYLDIAVSFLLVVFALVSVCSYILRAYEREASEKDSLLQKFDLLSKQEPLTGLYNRRFLERYLESVVWVNRREFFLFVLSLDNLKKIRYDFGYAFGDKVICTVAEILKGNVRDGSGECAASYGDGTFVVAMRADDDMDAFIRADDLRERVAGLSWEESPSLKVTINGGIAACSVENEVDRDRLARILDSILDASSSRGENQVRNMSLGME